MTTITIPPEAVEAAARAIEQSLKTARITLESEDGYKPEARAAILAALGTWPDAGMSQFHEHALILPLTENTDAKT